VPPFTVPYLGYIEVTAAVNALVKVTGLGAGKDVPSITT
jgi:hypothetical protein